MFTKEVFLTPFTDLWGSVVAVLPKLILAIIVFIIGWIIAKVVYKAIVKLAQKLKIDEAVKPMAGAVERAGYKLSIGKTVGFLVKWLIIIGALTISLDFLDLETTKALLIGIISYIPQVIIAIFVLMAGMLLADFAKKLVKGSTKMLNVKSASLLSNITRIAIIVFTVLVVLNLLGIGAEIVNTLFIGAVAMIALAGGLAFGLGGRDAAAKAIENAKHALHK